MDVDDLLQDVLLKVWRRLSTFRSESSFRTWMTRVAINEVLQTYRRDKRHAVCQAFENLDAFTISLRIAPQVPRSRRGNEGGAQRRCGTSRKVQGGLDPSRSRTVQHGRNSAIAAVERSDCEDAAFSGAADALSRSSRIESKGVAGSGAQDPDPHGGMTVRFVAAGVTRESPRSVEFWHMTKLRQMRVAIRHFACTPVSLRPAFCFFLNRIRMLRVWRTTCQSVGMKQTTAHPLVPLLTLLVPAILNAASLEPATSKSMGRLHCLGNRADGAATGPGQDLPVDGRIAGATGEGSIRRNRHFASCGTESEESAGGPDSRLDWRSVYSEHYA